MRTSRAAVHRLLDPKNTSVTLAQPRRRNRVQLILLSIFSGLARRLIPSAVPKRRCRRRACLTMERTRSSDGLSRAVLQLRN
jgi:hypothetical protein